MNNEPLAPSSRRQLYHAIGIGVLTGLIVTLIASSIRWFTKRRQRDDTDG